VCVCGGGIPIIIAGSQGRTLDLFAPPLRPLQPAAETNASSWAMYSSAQVRRSTMGGCVQVPQNHARRALHPALALSPSPRSQGAGNTAATPLANPTRHHL